MLKSMHGRSLVLVYKRVLDESEVDDKNPKMAGAVIHRCGFPNK